jgi:hypothetical protein
MVAGRSATDASSEARNLMELARWYRAWAGITESDEQKSSRLALANHLEALACKLAERGQASC